MIPNLGDILKSRAESNQASGPYRVTISRVIEDGSYNFVIDSWDIDQEFGPALGPLGLSNDDYAFALCTVDGEWFLIRP